MKYATRKIRYGLIGCGDMGLVHALSTISVPGIEILALADPVPAHLKNVLKALPYTPRRYHDYRSLLELQEIDAVIISTPNNTHTGIVLDSFQAGKHVFCEKPLACNIAECDQMISAAKKNKKILQVGLVYRYSKVFRRMSRIIKEGLIGRPVLIWCHEFRVPFPVGRGREWRYNQQTSGGALLEKDCHHFDLFNWMLGSLPKKVSAFGGQNVVGIKKGIALGVPGEPYRAKIASQVIDNAWVNIEYENGSRANLGLSFFCRDRDLSLGVIGSHGWMEAWVKAQKLDLFTNKTDRKKTCCFSERILGRGVIGHPGGVNQHLEFAECIRKGREPFCNGQIARESLYAAIAGEISIREQRVVEISEVLGRSSGMTAPLRGSRQRL